MATKPDPEEIINPKKRLARQMAEAEGGASAPKPKPAEKPAMGQAERAGLYGSPLP